MSGREDDARSGFDWRSLLLLTVLAISFFVGRLVRLAEVERLQVEAKAVGAELARIQSQYPAAAAHMPAGAHDVPDPSHSASPHDVIVVP